MFECGIPMPIIFFVILFAHFCVVFSSDRALQSIESNEHLCHCENNTACGETFGDCPEGKCAQGWFGPACLYYSSVYETTDNLAYLKGGNNQECTQATREDIFVTLDTPHPLTWLRIVVSSYDEDPRYDEGPRFIITTAFNKDSERTPCSCEKSAKVDNKTFDVWCPSSEALKYFMIKGVGIHCICSLTISKGRNVALNEEQVTGFGMPINSNLKSAVDGKIPGKVANSSTIDAQCVTLYNKTPLWTLNFSHSVTLNSVEIYSCFGLANCKQSLAEINFFAADEKGNIIYNHTGTGTDSFGKYMIVPSPILGQNVDFIGVGFLNLKKAEYMTLCEVVVFGESVCSSGKYGRNCDKLCNCASQEECFVSTGGCPSGCASGYTGEACHTPCPRGSYGLGCSQVCSVNCYGTCHHVNGSCYQGCNPGYESLFCNQTCSGVTWGQDCSETCSEHCKGACDHINGTCDQDCEPGFQPPLCRDKCPVGKFGSNCAHNCSETCIGSDSMCNHIDGTCSENCRSGHSSSTCSHAWGQRGNGLLIETSALLLVVLHLLL